MDKNLQKFDENICLCQKDAFTVLFAGMQVCHS